nr:ATP-dependent helicase HrpB [Deltaproteobacteria bacterium]
MIALPIDDVLPSLLAALRASSSVVLEAPPGAGKTTRVPSALLDSGLAGDREVVVLEPRRLATRMAAKRVAEERGEPLGQTIGYQVRFEDVSSAKTRVRFVTEGVLTRRLLSDPTLSSVGVVVLDEFHERHLQGDLALAMVRRLQRGPRPDLKLVVMSATLDGARVAAFLGEGTTPATRVTSEGRRFEVAIEHQARTDERPLEQQVAGAVRALVKEGLDGDVLVFLPGAAEIRRAMSACASLATEADLLVLPLHGDLPSAEQDRAVAPASRRKVILSTNVAETSVTIDGVVAVVDSGLARVASHAPWSGVPTLKVAKVSRASATQRAGRAGRTRPGRCVRLYTKHDHDARPEHDAPEVQRMDLADTALALHAAGERDLRAFPWFEAPGSASVDAAERLLRDLGALDEGGALTATGRSMLALPTHPRLARVVVEGARRGLLEVAAGAAAVLGERDLVMSRRGGGLGGARDQDWSPSNGRSDVLAALDALDRATEERFNPGVLRAMGVDPMAASAADRARKQLLTAVRRDRSLSNAPLVAPGNDWEDTLGLALLAGYPDRVARRLRGDEVALASGGSATLAATSEARGGAFVLAIDAEERTDHRGRGVQVRTACVIEPEWLLELFPDGVIDAVEARWVAADERVDPVRVLRYRGLVLDESRASPSPEVDKLVTERLLEEARRKGLRSFVEDADAVDRWLARVAFVADRSPALGLPTDADALLELGLRQCCVGARTMAEVRRAGLLDALRDGLTGPQRRALDELAPERVALGGGKMVRVMYEPGKAPWIESRLQDFFGCARGPAVAGGKVPLVLNLLAPNHRAVQVTTDLEGFWVKHYPAIRRELCRKYPRHSWPEDGRTAQPPAALGRAR